jgi:4-hydroxy-3-methylbut-2-enyl diphosphate reductase
MKIILSKPRGFCAGVVRAIDTVEKALELWGAPIYVKHQIVHNCHVVKRLEDKGAIFIEEIDDVPEGARLIYSAHGVSPEIRQQAQKRQLQEIDATCSLVTRIHSAAKRFASKGYHILLIGHRNHVEIIGTAGEAPNETTVIETVADVENLSFPSTAKLFYITQTTLSIEDVKDITQALEKKYPSIETLPTSSICYATTNRQVAIKQIASNVDLILVVGDPTSSNSNRLREVAEHQGVRAYLINSFNEINPVWLKNVNILGVSAGASTPEDVVQQCIDYLITLGVNEVEEVTVVEEHVFFQLPKEVQVTY